MTHEFNRRGFLKAGTAAGLGATFGGVQLAASAATADLPLPKEVNLPAIDEVRIAIIGVGGRGCAAGCEGRSAETGKLQRR